MRRSLRPLRHMVALILLVFTASLASSVSAQSRIRIEQPDSAEPVEPTGEEYVEPAEEEYVEPAEEEIVEPYDEENDPPGEVLSPGPRETPLAFAREDFGAAFGMTAHLWLPKSGDDSLEEFGGGVGFWGGVETPIIPMILSLGGRYTSLDSSSQLVYEDLNESTYLNRDSSVLGFEARARFQPRWRIQPIAELFVGTEGFQVSSEREEQLTFFGETDVVTETLFSEWSWSQYWGAGIGVAAGIPLDSGAMLGLEIGLRYIDGEEVDYYPSDALVRDQNNQWFLDTSRVKRVQDDHYKGYLGLSLRI